MQNVFKNDSATVDRLVEAFLFFEQKEEALRPELEEAIRKTVELQQDSMLGENNSKDLKAAKENQQELTLRLEACKDGKGRIIERLKIRLPLEAKAEIEVIENEIQPKLNAERSALLTQYAESLAQTNALKESLDGIWGKHCHRDSLLAVGSFRDRCSDSGIDIHKKITDAREKSKSAPSNRDRRHTAHKEKEQLQTIIRNPDTAIEDLLRKAGARDFQPKPKPPLPTEKGLLDAGGWTERDVREEIGNARFMGYVEFSPPQVEYSKCMAHGHDYYWPEGAKKRLCRRCGQSERVEEINPQPKARPQCPDDEHVFSMGVCKVCGYTQAAAQFS